MPTPLSAYILTKNSEQYLAQILNKISSVADEILVVDSGSTDNTAAIAAGFPLVRFIVHPFVNFKTQRDFAAESCLHDMVLFLDSDEIPDNAFIEGLQKLKTNGFDAEAYEVDRYWWVLGRKIHALYPIVSPDAPIRLYDRRKVSFKESSFVHETPSGYSNKKKLQGHLQHYTFETKLILNKKLELYTEIAAQDLLRQGKNIGFWKRLSSPFAAFFKWYFLKGGFRDGLLGLYLGAYAYRYTQKKYQKALNLAKNQSTSS